MTQDLAHLQHISGAILVLRGQRVILDRDLAALYGVSTKRLNEAVRRSAKRFPADFMFQLTPDEANRSRSQFATLKVGRGQNIKYLPHAFTEHGAIQAANVLNSTQAVEMGIHVVRTFIRLRELLASNKVLAAQMDELERKYQSHDKAIATMLATIRQLLREPVPKSRAIGFTANVD